MKKVFEIRIEPKQWKLDWEDDLMAEARKLGLTVYGYSEDDKYEAKKIHARVKATEREVREILKKLNEISTAYTE